MTSPTDAKRLAERLLAAGSLVTEYYRPFKFNPDLETPHERMIAAYFGVATNHGEEIATALIAALSEIDAARAVVEAAERKVANEDAWDKFEPGDATVPEAAFVSTNALRDALTAYRTRNEACRGGS